MTAAVTTGVCPRCNLPIPVAVHQCARPGVEAAPPYTRWAVQGLESGQWLTVSGGHTDRGEALARLAARRLGYPGVAHRLIRTHTTHTIEDA